MGRRSLISLAEEDLDAASQANVMQQDVDLTITATNVFFENQTAKESILVNRGGAGSSKCFVLGTEIVMADGSLRKVEFLRAGDYVLGIDSKPRRILEVHSGHGPLFRIDQTKGISYTVNGEHILALKYGPTAEFKDKYKSLGDYTTIAVKDFVKQSKIFKYVFRGYKVLADLPHKDVAIDPYFLGLWLGDGDSHRAGITTMDEEIVDYLYQFAKQEKVGVVISKKSKGRARSYHLTNGTYKGMPRKGSNPLYTKLKDYNLISNKHIPDDYLYTDRESRLQLLAGLIDTDGYLSKPRKGKKGYCYHVGQANETLTRQILQLAQSLGFKCSMWKLKTGIKSTGFVGNAWLVRIIGDITDIPVRIIRKRAPLTGHYSTLISTLKVTPVGEGDYIGFSIGGDHLFFLKDYTVVHNSYSLSQLMLYKFFNENQKKILVLRKTLPSLRISTLPVMKDQLQMYSLWDKVTEEKVHLNWYYNGALIHFQGLDDAEKIKCFHPDTELLTDKGWKLVGSIKIGDLVATVDPATRKMFYKPVKKSFAYDYKGFLYEPSSESGCRNTSLKFAVTPEHRMLINECNKPDKPFTFMKAKDLEKRSHYKFARYSFCADGNVVDHITVPAFDDGNYRKKGKKDRTFAIVPFLKFLGWYISEGTANEKGTIYIAQKKEVGRAILKEDIKDFPYIHSEEENGFVFHGKDLALFLRSAVGVYSQNKSIPRQILDLHPDLLRHLFNALIAGDGMWVKGAKGRDDYRWYYDTTSKQLADDVSELGFKLGYAISGHSYKTVKGSDAWRITGFDQCDSGCSKLKKTPYKGKVHCIEVPPFNTLVSRYSQVVVITGNSSDWNYIWIEEATEFTWEEYQTIKLRLRAETKDGIPNQMFLSFNPIDERHWIKEKLVEDPTQDTKEIVSSYRDNPFLPAEYIKDLENLQFQDISFYNVYTLGQWGKLENLIYKNWDICSWWPDKSAVDHVFYGLDFGFNDPSALIECRVKGKDCWEKEHLYHTKLTNSDLIQKLQMLIPEEKRRAHVIYADSAEPDRIKEIKDAGFRIKPAIKRVEDGIDIVKRYSVHILEDSLNLIKEKRAYSWKKDRNGNVTDEPIGIWDHLMSAERYAIHSGLKGGGVRVRFI